MNSTANADRPAAISEMILKLNRKCNLRCTYCYYINDNTLNTNSRMPLSIAKKAISDYSTYCHNKSINGAIILHGGEPLLQGKKYLENLFAYIATECENIDVSIQTNGTLIDDEWLDLFEQYSVSFGISFDGSIEQNDKNRKMANGKTHSEALVEIINKVKNLECFGGILSVIDPSFSGKVAVRFFRELGVKWVDFLIPYSTHDVTTANVVDCEKTVGRFLVDAFLEWIRIDDASFTIRIFEDFLRNGIHYSKSGLKPPIAPRIICVEVDGQYCRNTEFSESALLFDRNFYHTGFSVGEVSVDIVEQDLHAFAMLNNFDRFSPSCARCDMNALCRAGPAPSRYKRGHGFQNPSASCFDYYLLSKTVRAYLDKAQSPDIRMGGFDDNSYQLGKN